MGKIERVEQGLADVFVSVTRERAYERIHRVAVLDNDLEKDVFDDADCFSCLSLSLSMSSSLMIMMLV